MSQVVVLPYLLIIAIMLFAITFGSDDEALFGYYCFALLSAVSYTILAVSVVFLHIKESLSEQKWLLAFKHAPHLAFPLSLALIIGLSGATDQSVTASQIALRDMGVLRSTTPTEVLVSMSVPESENIQHVVVSGDSLWGIAEHYFGNGVEWTGLEVDRPDPDLIYPGDVVVVPLVIEVELSSLTKN